MKWKIWTKSLEMYKKVMEKNRRKHARKTIEKVVRFIWNWKDECETSWLNLFQYTKDIIESQTNKKTLAKAPQISILRCSVNLSNQTLINRRCSANFCLVYYQFGNLMTMDKRVNMARKLKMNFCKCNHWSENKANRKIEMSLFSGRCMYIVVEIQSTLLTH